MIRRILRKLSSIRKKQILEQRFEGYNYALFTNMQPQYQNHDIGDYTYGSPQVFNSVNYDDVANKPTKLIIGKFCSIASDAKIIMGSEHRIDWVTTYPFNVLNNKFRHIKGHPFTKGDIVIGNDVWIATNAAILSGVTIGNGAVIGANSLVINNVPAYTVVAGVPAKVIKQRFSEDVIRALEEIKWWDMPIDFIENNAALLQSADIKLFIENARQFIKNK